MFVIVVGGGKVGSYLTGLLRESGHRVKLIENRQFVLDRLKEELPDEVIVNGDGSDPNLLESIGVREANVLAAVTGQDDANLVITTLARYEFNVPRVIARVNNPKNAWIFTPEMGVDVALNQADIFARLIAEEMSLGDMMTLLKLRKGEFSIVEEKVHPESIASGKAIRDLHLPEECILIAVIHKGELLLPRGDTVLNAADEVLAVVQQSKLDQLAAVLGKPPAS
jgi:trk system potassium uptake protein TrkA